MKKKINFGVIIQARMKSSRLPNKVLLKYKKITPLQILIDRLKKSKKIDAIYVATTKARIDKKIVDFCKKNSINYYRGAKNNVLSRYYFTAQKFNIYNVIRITSDCPLVDYRIVDEMINIFEKKNLEYLANTYPLPTTYPDGMDIEIFKRKTLFKTYQNATLPSEKEHVTPYMFKYKKFKIFRIDYKKNFSKFRLCIDYYKDYRLFCKIIDHFKSKIYESNMENIINFLKKNPKLISYQKKIKRNEGWASSLKKDQRYKNG